MKGISLRVRVLLGCLLVAMIPLLICSFVILNVFRTTLNRITLEEGSHQITLVTTWLTGLFASCEETGQLLAESKLATEMLQRPQADQSPTLYAELYRAAGGLTKGANVFLCSADGVGMYTAENLTGATQLPVDWGVLRQARNSTGMVYYGTESDPATPSSALMHCARAIRTQAGAVVGYLVIELTAESFQTIPEGPYSLHNNVYISDRFLAPIYSNLSSGAAEQLAHLRQEYMSTGRLVSTPGSNLLYHITTEPLSGCRILLEQPTQITAGAMELMNRIILMATAVCVALCLLISSLLSRSLTRPVWRLNVAMEQVKAGNLTVRVENRRNDELGQLTQNFNHMTEELEEYLSSSIQRQKELNDAQIRMLQAQLNPHFLYNTLDTMKWLGKINGIPEIASLAGGLAVILRGSISQGQFVTLTQELDMTQRYIAIQRIRFSGRFECIMEIPARLMDCIVPKLFLQPLIENAIIHGLKDSSSGNVYLYATERDGTIALSVTDDGCGMDGAMIEKLNSGGLTLQDGHLGLYNVDTILRMHYGQQYGLHASATRGVGTTVTATLPLQKEEQNA